MISMGDFLKAKREEKNITQKELSNYLGYSTSQCISNYERGVCPVPIKMLAKISEYIGISEREVKKFYLEQQAVRFDQFFNNKKVKRPQQKVVKKKPRKIFFKVGQHLPY